MNVGVGRVLRRKVQVKANLPIPLATTASFRLGKVGILGISPRPYSPPLVAISLGQATRRLGAFTTKAEFTAGEEQLRSGCSYQIGSGMWSWPPPRCGYSVNSTDVTRN